MARRNCSRPPLTSPACSFLSATAACAATISSFARGTATDLGCAAMNPLRNSILSSSGKISACRSSCSFSSSGGVAATSGLAGERVGRAAVSFAALGDGCATGPSTGGGVFTSTAGLSVTCGDATGDGEGCAIAGVSDGGEVGVPDGEGDGVSIGCADGVSDGLGDGVSVACGVGLSTTLGRVCAITFSAGC